MTPTALFIGNQDEFAVSARRHFESSGLRCVVIDESDIHTLSVIPAANPQDFIRLVVNKKSFEWPEVIAVFSNHLSLHSIVANDPGELFWSEWTAFLGYLLLGHPKVFNPPALGSWCGAFPNIFDQLSCARKQLELAGVRTPTTLRLCELLWLNRALRQPTLSDLMQAPPEAYPEFSPGACSSEIILPFVDDHIVCDSDNEPLACRLAPVVRAFQVCTASRIGQLSILRNNDTLLFRYILSRPLPSTLKVDTWRSYISYLMYRALE